MDIINPTYAMATRESYLKYFQIKADEEDLPASADEVITAFTDGYVASLMKMHVYSPVLFLTGKTLREEISKDLKSIDKELHDAVPDFCAKCWGLPTTSVKPYRKADLCTSFMYGYIAAIHKQQRFDMALFLQGHALRTHIMGDLLFEDKKHENAARAQTRIIRHLYRPKRAVMVDGDGKEVPIPSDAEIISGHDFK